MGKKAGWFSAVRKALSPQLKEKKEQKAKSKNNNQTDDDNTDAVTSYEPVAGSFPPPPPPPPPLPHDQEKQSGDNNVNDSNNGQNKHGYSAAIATAAAAEAAVVAPHVAAEVVRHTTVPRFVGKSKEEIAAIKVQTAFRGYLARRALRALRGLVRLKSLIEGQSVKRQAATTLRCMQTLARVQSQIRARRIRMSEDNQALQRQIQQKHERELEKLRMGEEWDDSILSKEQIEADLQSKQEAALRRERALAYAYTHQQSKKNNKHANPTFLDPNNPHWGWSWLERWMAARPWESRTLTDNDPGSVKGFRSLSVAGEINRAYALRDFSLDKPSLTAQKSSRPPSRQSPSTPARPKTKPASPSPKVNGWGPEDETKSMMSVQSERHRRRHSIGGSIIRDDESLASSAAVPSYMTPTRSAKARNKPPGPSPSPSPSPMGVVENTNTPSQKQAAGSAKKRLSFPVSTGGLRRHSVPGKIESTPVKV